MSQASVSSFFITRKRGIEDDDVISNKKKVICLERTRKSSESHETGIDSDELGAKVVFSKAFDSQSSNDDEPKLKTKKPTMRQGITPQRTRTRRIHMQEVDGIAAPKIVNFWKGGNLSPQKKSKATIEQSTPTATTTKISETETKSVPDALNQPDLSSPAKQIVSAASVEKTAVVSGNVMRSDEIQKKLKASSRLAELKTSLNKLQGGMDRLDRMEKMRLATDSLRKKSEPTAVTPKSLKPFKTIELEIMSPTKRLSSPLKLKDSPMKNSLMGSPKVVTPKRLFNMTSPLKMSPVKAPAYQRFQNLAEAGTPTLQLPFKFRYLLEIFKAVDTVCAMFFNRKEKITFKKMKPAVQRIVRKNFHESHLAQIQKLMPDAYKFAQEKTRNYGSTSKADYYQLVITPNVGSSQDDVKQLTLSPQILIERSKKMTQLLTELVFDEHEKFLQTLDVPLSVTRGSLKRWHAEFDLEKVPDIEQEALPQPPNVERFSSAKDVLGAARNLFHCSTPMERALERLEAKKKEEKPKQIQHQEQQQAKLDSTPADGVDEANDERKKQAAADTTSSLLKGVPKSLLDKIRAKQAAKALDMMTRRPSQERETAKFARLPEIARHARNVYVTEKKGVLLLEVVLKKIENSYKGNVTMKEIEELLKMIAALIPTWISFCEIRNQMYVKLARDSDLTAVVGKLEKLASEKAKF